MSIAVARAFPTRAEARPPVKSTEKFVVAHKRRGWRFLSAREAREEHLAHRLDGDSYLDSVVAYFQLEETRRAFAHATRRPELEKKSSFMKWVRGLMHEEEEEARKAIEAEIRQEENNRLWFPFRNASEASMDD